MKKFCLNFSNRIIYYIAFIIITFLTLDSFLRTCYISKPPSEYFKFKWDNIILNIIVILLFLGILIALCKFLKNKRFNYKVYLSILLIIYFIISLIWVIMAKCDVNLESDSEMIFNYVKDFVSNDYSSLTNMKYFYLFPYQLGLAFYEEILYIVFSKNALFVFQFINVLATTLCIYSMIKSFDLITDNKYINNKLIPFLLFMCFHLIFYCSFIYGNTISFCFLIYGIYFWLKFLKQKKKRIISITLSVCFLTLSYTLKSTALIFIVGIVIITCIEFLNNKNKLFIIYLISLLIAFSIPLKIIQFHYHNKVDIHQSSGIPKIGWVVMGTVNEKNRSRPYGWYNEWHIDHYLTVEGDNKKYKKDSYKILKKNIYAFVNSPSYFAKYFYVKTTTQWNDPTYQSNWVIHSKSKNKFIKSIVSGKILKIYQEYCNFYQLIIYIGVLLYLIFNRKKDTINYTFLLMFIGGFIFYLFWEAKGQYVFPFFVILIPYAGMGWTDLINKYFLKSKNS